MSRPDRIEQAPFGIAPSGKNQAVPLPGPACRLDRLRVTVWTRLKQLLLTCYACCIRVRIVGRVALPLRRGFIVAANHLNGADSVVLQAALRTRLFFVASARWFRTRFSRFIMWHICDAVPVSPDDPLGSAAGIRHCIRALRHGASIGIYPEGRFNTTGRLELIEDGAAYLAARTGTPILPVYIHRLRFENQVDTNTQTRECWTGFLTVAGNLFNTRIELAVGEPIQPNVARFRNRAALRAEVARLNAALLAEFDHLATSCSRPPNTRC